MHYSHSIVQSIQRTATASATMILLVLFALCLSLTATVTGKRCSHDWECDLKYGTSICSHEEDGFCYPTPRHLNDRCYQSSHCRNYVEFSTECLNYQCVCKSGTYASGNVCKSTFVWLTYAVFVPLGVFFVVAGIAVKLIRERMAKRREQDSDHRVSFAANTQNS